LSYLDLSLSGSGLIRGSHLAARLKEALADTLIENLPMRFAAIATELNTGHEVWLTRGRMVDALAASYALPGIFPPAQIGGRWLVDGVLVNPVPVSAARALDARLVIAVNLNLIYWPRTIIANHGPTTAMTQSNSAKAQGCRHVQRRNVAAPALPRTARTPWDPKRHDRSVQRHGDAHAGVSQETARCRLTRASVGSVGSTSIAPKRHRHWRRGDGKAIEGSPKRYRFAQPPSNRSVK
jgi:predicted acylesterase/phospholipase RssA